MRNSTKQCLGYRPDFPLGRDAFSSRATPKSQGPVQCEICSDWTPDGVQCQEGWRAREEAGVELGGYKGASLEGKEGASIAPGSQGYSCLSQCLAFRRYMNWLMNE